MVDSRQVMINNWVMRVHYPQGNGPFPLLLMLHGWTGDENSMWVFASRLPQNWLMIAPRGMYPSPKGGYSWHPEVDRRWPLGSDFQNGIEAIHNTISPSNFPQGDFSDLHLIGFSQGTAFSYMIAIQYPEQITSVAGLSGFLPEDTSHWLTHDRLKNLPFFIAHGTQDELVPVDKARMSVRLLEAAGAAVTYCEDDVGHKLSAKCFHGLEAFYQKVNR